MLKDGLLIPRFGLHHQILLHAIERVFSVVILLRARQIIAEPRIFAVADEAQVAEGIEHIWRQWMRHPLGVPIGMLRVVVLHRTSEAEFVGFHGLGRPVLEPK